MKRIEVKGQKLVRLFNYLEVKSLRFYRGTTNTEILVSSFDVVSDIKILPNTYSGSYPEEVTQLSFVESYKEKSEEFVEIHHDSERFYYRKSFLKQFYSHGDHMSEISLSLEGSESDINFLMLGV